MGVGHLFVGGLATDYCVRSTVLDGLRAGFGATVLLDAIRGVNVAAGDAERAIAEMVEAGAAVTTLGRLELLWAAGRMSGPMTGSNGEREAGRAPAPRTGPERVIVYTKRGCGWCYEVLSLLDSRGDRV